MTVVKLEWSKFNLICHEDKDMKNNRKEQCYYVWRGKIYFFQLEKCQTF
jgi:hypothetical protein